MEQTVEREMIVIENNATPTKDEKTWAMLCHLSVFSFILGIPVAHIIAPLIIWLIKKNQSQFVDYHGKQSLNFQITITLICLIGIVFYFLVIGSAFFSQNFGFIRIALMSLSFIIILVCIITDIVSTIRASIRAYRGEYYKYALSFKFLK